jgi:hypothetical protein
MARRTLVSLVAAIPFSAFAACSRAPAEPATTKDPAGSVSSEATSAGPRPSATPPPKRELALLWDDAPTLTRTTPKSPARAAEYVVPRVGTDPEDGECVVMTFGPHQGGSVDDNVKRWVDQFHPALPTPRRTSVEVNGMRMTFVEVAGTYAGNMMPNAQGVTSPTDKPGWRLLGAVVEAPSGLWFFKLTGPDVTVRSGARQFEDMVRSARPR